MPIQIKKVNWECPDNIKAFHTTRIGGSSKGLFKYSNLSFDVGDGQTNVKKNRKELRQLLKLDVDPCWMKQIHSSYVKKVVSSVNDIVCDASYTQTKGLACAVLSADCLPILICDKLGTKVGVIHVGWRGLHNGIIKKFINKFSKSPKDIICWIGPSISPVNYVVREDVYKKLSKITPKMFNQLDDEHWNLDLRFGAKIVLKSLGIKKIYSNDMCTFQNSNLYYSYRRENNTGRIASLIWIE